MSPQLINPFALPHDLRSEWVALATEMKELEDLTHEEAYERAYSELTYHLSEGIVQDLFADARYTAVEIEQAQVVGG